ncbi:MAG: NAD(P)/FAD-dependent oxidoreductase, partial [Verrucomicrobiaceae bacterium]
MNPSRIHDVVIAGGGPAGLSAALLLGRCMRDTVLCEAESRDGDSASSTGCFLGHDGCLPSELLRMGREQVAKFESVTRLTTAVSDIQRTLTGFTVVCGDGSKLETRSVLVVPKSVPLLPEIEGLADFIGTSVHQFPDGDGWDHQGQKLGVIGCDDSDAELAMKLLVW